MSNCVYNFSNCLFTRKLGFNRNTTPIMQSLNPRWKIVPIVDRILITQFFLSQIGGLAKNQYDSGLFVVILILPFTAEPFVLRLLTINVAARVDEDFRCKTSFSFTRVCLSLDKAKMFFSPIKLCLLLSSC